MKEYKTLSKINGPLLFLKGVSGVGLNETAEIVLPSGEVRIGKVLEIDQDTSIVECLEGTEGIGTDARVRFFGKPFTVFVSKDMLGCTFDGRGNPIDVRPLAEKEVDINTPAINPLFRASPSEFIETGFSAIDGLL
ncbi:MAG: V-type ATP synthase subunit B, partial [Candidatus Aenigmarchaeota archaeon]|nr:V-type ATP synthase subunit B [Candidatus Aenigmarchaeota archaeon]